MPYNTRLSRSRGRSFEDQIVKRLSLLGYTSKKNVLSGATLKKPYDIKVSPYRLKVEAKRTLKDFITIKAKWVDRISSLFIVVFSVGRQTGRPLEMWSISMFTDMNVDHRAFERDKTTTVVMKKAKRLHGLEIKAESTFLLAYGDKTFVVEPLEQYLQAKFPLPVKE